MCNIRNNFGLLSFSFFLIIGFNSIYSQVLINSVGNAFTQKFDLIGNSATSQLPACFKIGTDWSSVTTATTKSGVSSVLGILAYYKSGVFYNFANANGSFRRYEFVFIK